MMARLVIVLVATLSLAPPSAAAPSAARAAAWDRLRMVSGEAMVRWSAVDDVPISIRSGSSGVPLPGWTTDRATAVQGLFRDQADLFRLRAGIDVFEIAGERVKSAIHHLRMIQMYRGLPVRGGQYMVSVGGEGRLRMIAGRSIPDIESEVEPALTPARAIAAAIASLRRAPGSDSISTALAIEPGDERDRLVYEVRVQGRSEPFAREVLVDARDGTIAGIRDLGFGASGCAAIWDPNPDHPLREDDFELADPVAGVARLEGPQVRVLHQDVDEPASNTVLPHGCFDFRFDPVTQVEAFDQANVYRHVDHFLREFHGGNGFGGMPQPITVTIRPFRCGESNTGETIGNAIWLTSGGCGYKSSTRDADIINHETQHAVNNAFGLEGGTDLGREIYATAIHESFANYFACAAHDDPIYAEYFFGPQGFANCNSDPAEFHYARRFELGIGTLQNYLIGMIWSGALWDIRTVIGPIMDRIALESLDYLPSTPSMHNAVDAVLQADRDLHDGQHQAEMIAAFAGRGLGPGVPGVVLEGPDERLPGEFGTWSARICCGTAPYTYEWSRVMLASTTIESIGTDSVVTTSADGSFALRLRVADADGRVVLMTRNIRIVSAPPAPLVIEGPTAVLSGVMNLWTARAVNLPADARYSWTQRCLGCGSPATPIGADTKSVATRLFVPSVLRVTISSSSGSIFKEIQIQVDAPPQAILPAPPSLYPGERALLVASASGGIPPYTWRWTRNGLGSEHLIGTAPQIEVVGDTVAFDLYLTATTSLGIPSTPVRRTIVPRMFEVEIDGLSAVAPRVELRWHARFGGPRPPNARIQWTRTCLDPGCLREVVGQGDTLILASSRNFDLGLLVETGFQTVTRSRRIRVDGVPTAAVLAPDWLAPGEPLTLRAEVADGKPPFTYRWSRDGLGADQVIGTESTLWLRGDGRDVDLFLIVTSADGLQSDAVHRVIRSGLGPRPTADRPAFTVDRTVVREGGELTFTLEGSPGSRARLKLLDVSGREVTLAFDGTLAGGAVFVPWRSNSLRSGVYLAVARIAGQILTRRVTVIQ